MDYFMGLCTILAMVTPLFAISNLVPPPTAVNDYDYATAVPMAATLFSIADVFFVIWATGRLEASSVKTVLAVGSYATLSGLMLMVLSLTGEASQTTSEAILWTAPFIIGILAGVVLIIRAEMAWMAMNMIPPTTGKHVTVQTGSHSTLKAAVGKLPMTEQLVIHEELATAIDELHHRGMVDEQTAYWAKCADVGELTVNMSRPQGTR